MSNFKEVVNIKPNGMLIINQVKVDLGKDIKQKNLMLQKHIKKSMVKNEIFENIFLILVLLHFSTLSITLIIFSYFCLHFVFNYNMTKDK